MNTEEEILPESESCPEHDLGTMETLPGQAENPVKEFKEYLMDIGVRF